MRRKSIAPLATLVCICCLAARGQAQNHAEGKFVVAGKPIAITQVYAYAQKGFFDPKKKDVVVLLCDSVLPAAAVHDASARGDLAKSGKVHCVEQTIDADKQVINFTVRDAHFKMPESGGSSYQVFEAKTFDGKTIAGRAHTTAEQKSFDDVPYSYDITFNASIEPMK